MEVEKVDLREEEWKRERRCDSESETVGRGMMRVSLQWLWRSIAASLRNGVR
ncbi:PLP-dependent transferase [Sesbania bispinosa]|nr:PLP-dependent transferase [Sesbania bispinosa]